jgi:two-component system, cell cycle sensor histidine kinase and response regulator CckA
MRRKVLIVEDEPIVALDLHEEVEQLGCEVVGIAESAEHAMAIAEIYRPDLALMDINILGCMDGIQTAQLLRCTYRIPSVFLTSYNDEATMKRAVQDLTYGYLTKPYKSHQLKAALMVAMHIVETEETALEAQGQIAAAVTAMHEGLLTVSLSGAVQFMNAAAERVTGVLPRDAYGRQLNELLALGDDFQIAAIQATAHGDCATAGAARTLQITDRNSLPLDMFFAPMTDNDGKLTGYAVTLRNDQLSASGHAGSPR